MSNFWLVAKHEYRNVVMRRGFVIGTIAVPLGLALLVGVLILVEVNSQNRLPVGYVDQVGFLDETLQPAAANDDDQIEIRAFADVASGIQALEQEEIQVVFVFPPEYPETVKTELYYLEEPPSDEAWGEFDDFVRLNLVQGLPRDVADRMIAGADVVVYDIASDREFSESSIINVIMPVVASFFFFFATMSAAGYLLGVIATEKENRMMETLLTSLTPGQLIGGKTLGLLAATLTQLTVYIITALLALRFATPFIELLQRAVVPWEYLGLMALFFFPAYGLVAAVMVAVGSAAVEMQQAQQVSGIVNLLFIAPLFLVSLLFANPNHPLIVFMTLFPTTAFLTVSLRWGLGNIPGWQLGLSWTILVGTTAFMIWAAARIFRAGMLRYGQPLSLKGAVASLRNQ